MSGVPGEALRWRGRGEMYEPGFTGMGFDSGQP